MFLQYIRKYIYLLTVVKVMLNLTESVLTFNEGFYTILKLRFLYSHFSFDNGNVILSLSKAKIVRFLKDSVLFILMMLKNRCLQFKLEGI